MALFPWLDPDWYKPLAFFCIYLLLPLNSLWLPKHSPSVTLAAVWLTGIWIWLPFIVKIQGKMRRRASLKPEWCWSWGWMFMVSDCTVPVLSPGYQREIQFPLKCRAYNWSLSCPKLKTVLKAIVICPERLWRKHIDATFSGLYVTINLKAVT